MVSLPMQCEIICGTQATLAEGIGDDDDDDDDDDDQCKQPGLFTEARKIALHVTGIRQRSD